MCVFKAVNCLELTERKSLRKNDTSQWFEQTQRALRMKLTNMLKIWRANKVFIFFWLSLPCEWQGNFNFSNLIQVFPTV